MLRPPLPLLAALFATAVAVTVALSWFGWRLLDQQRAIDEQRAREQLETSADATAAAIRGTLAEAAERLSTWLSNPSESPPVVENAIVLALGAGEVFVTPPRSLPFVPVPMPTPPINSFGDAEAIEFGGKLLVAADRYRVLAKTQNMQVRAGALLRFGRVLRKLEDHRGALSAYRELALLGSVRTDDLPAELVALDGQRAALGAMGNHAEESRVAAQLLQGIDEGRWFLTQGQAEHYRDEVTQAARPDSWRLAIALNDVWRETSGRLSARGQRVLSSDGREVLVLWRSTESRAAVLTAFADKFFRTVVSGVEWQLVDPEGRRISGAASVPPRSVTRILGNADYPWSLHVGSSVPAPPDTARNRNTLIGMMTAMLVFLWAATYFMARAIRREAEVARLQSDFVAAVSHEFRTPLTTVRQMTEMLEMNRLPTEERRQQYYRVLGGETARLQRLVETLLNFGRMEAGAARYQFANIDTAALVRDVVREIEPQARDSGKQIEISGPAEGVRVMADESALAVAVRNLIDNAIKYSPNHPTVWVEWTKENNLAAIRVVDRGLGIPRAEQDAIFRKFVRGRAAIDQNVKGTGVGLSMVQQIIAAHGGEVRLESEAGLGSTFTLLLPAAN